MNSRNLLFASIVAAIMSFAVAFVSQGLDDAIRVTLPEAVTIGDQVLDPGVYEIRRASTTQDQILQIYSNDKLRYETTVLTVPTVGEQTPEESKVVLHHIGNNYYFDKIWMAGKTYGYEFPLPKNVEALQRELALAVPATYQTAQSVATSESPQPAVQPSQPEAGAGSARQAESERGDQAGIGESSRVNPGAQEQQADRDRIASLQNEQRVAPAPDPRPVQTPATVQRDTQTSAQEQKQLPATASNWMGFLLCGVLLLTLGALIRPQRRQE